LHYIDIQATDYGLKHIGHMGYFRQGAEQLWDEVLAKFSELHQLKNAA
ncbi:MAG TPA: alpha/beta hydrolase, partial [Acinetobacter sp.]|nr:alpha/beta hydrolase [Acinetobacter sp.]